MRTYRNAAEAQSVCAAWKKHLPPVRSAYRPSGIAPPAAVRAMWGGAVAGALIGIAAALAVAVVCGLLGAGLFRFAEVIPGRRWAILPIGAGLFPMGGGLAMASWLCAYFPVLHVLEAGRRHKNRSDRMAVQCSVAGALIAALVFWAVFRLVGPHLSLGAPLHQTLTGAVLRLDQLGWAAIPAGLAVSVGAALYLAREAVRTEPFCEYCSEFMELVRLGSLSFEGAQHAGHALERDPKSVAQVMKQHPGDAAGAILSRCTTCGKGFLEVHAEFEGSWEDRGVTDTLERHWVTASRALDGEEVEVLLKA